MRHKPKYNSQLLIYKNLDDEESMFYCDELESIKMITSLIGQPIKDSGTHYITDSDIDFVIDGTIIQGEDEKRIINIPKIKPAKDNNSRRGQYRKDKVIVTT